MKIRNIITKESLSRDAIFVAALIALFEVVSPGRSGMSGAWAKEPQKLAVPGLTLQIAQKLMASALACGDRNHWRLSVAIVNLEGNLVSFARSDGSYTGSIKAAIDKATSASVFQRSTRVFVEAVNAGNLGLLSVKDVVANEGGLPIESQGQIIGGIGISGAKSTEDEKCARSALASVVL